MSLMPDVTHLLTDPELGAQTFAVTRTTGVWVGGRLTFPDGSEETFNAVGIIQPPSPDHLQYFPEGERREGEKVIYTKTILHMSDKGNVSDVITWHGEAYKIVRVDRWDDWGYCAAYAVKR